MMLGGCSLSRALRPETYTVHRGDTLSTIAAQYGIDWHDLARWNRIGPPYRIDVGQQIWLDPYPPLRYSEMPATSNTAGQRVVRAPQDSRAEQERSIQASTPQLTRTIETPARPSPTRGANSGITAPPAASKPEQANAQVADEADDARVASASQKQSNTPAHFAGPNKDGWQWPASGSILREYNPDQGRQGIEIGGRVGAPIYAASSGHVVYNGSGLKGYGKLVIIKHNEHYLSAYGFNQRTFVKQGQKVTAGAHIANMGLGPENKPMLHFEIRRDGKPIDPESLLPKQ